jgi:1-acyl-sn-glycerol-3-phosphate acyltransferase
MSSEKTRVRCVATTRAGTPCKNYAQPGSEFCRVHQPAEAPAEPEALPSEPPFAGGESAADLRCQLADELDRLIGRLRSMVPEQGPLASSARALLGLFQETVGEWAPGFGQNIRERVQGALKADILDPDTWRGMWYIVNYALQSQADFVKRRLAGKYETDEWGLDREILDAVQPFFTFLYKTYWRVQTTGIEHFPAEGRALLVPNHSGQLPWDAAMIATAVYLEHPNRRLVRCLYSDWVPTLPFLSALSVKLGHAQATVDNGIRLLEQDQLVAVFPEGHKGIGKLYRDRYRLARFGRGGFIEMALRTATPIIPVAVVGAEETFVSWHRSETLAKLTGAPFFPVGPTFPWFGLLGLVPLPTQWYIDFGQPIPTDGYGPDAAEDPILASQMTDQVRNVVQRMVNERLGQRKSVFLG